MKGSPPLEAQHPPLGAGKLDQPHRDVALIGGGLAAALAGIFELGTWPDPAQDVGIDQGVVDDGISALHGMISEQR